MKVDYTVNVARAWNVSSKGPEVALTCVIKSNVSLYVTRAGVIRPIYRGSIIPLINMIRFNFTLILD